MRQISKWNKQIRAIPSQLELDDLNPWPEMHRSSCKGTFSCMRKSWLTSRRMNQAQCGTFLLRWCSHGAFIWLRAAGTSQLDPWKIPRLHEIALNVQSFLILSLVIFCFSSRILPWPNLSFYKKQCQ